MGKKTLDPDLSIGRKRRRGTLPPALASFREPPDTGGSFSFYPPIPTGISRQDFPMPPVTMGKTGTTGKGTSYDEDRQHHPGKAPDRRTAPAGGLRCGGIFRRRVLSGGPRAAGGGPAGGLQAGKKRHGRAGGRGGGKHGLPPLRRGPAVLRDSGFDLCGAVRLPGYQVVPAGMVPARHCGGRWSWRIPCRWG